MKTDSMIIWRFRYAFFGGLIAYCLVFPVSFGVLAIQLAWAFVAAAIRNIEKH
jgi:hypothetical protein